MMYSADQATVIVSYLQRRHSRSRSNRGNDLDNAEQTVDNKSNKAFYTTAFDLKGYYISVLCYFFPAQKSTSCFILACSDNNLKVVSESRLVTNVHNVSVNICV